jgi:hypothetical protein
MGGKMNLNPLKKDENTDALVQALEDANSPDSTTDAGTQVPAVPPAPGADNSSTDASIIASDPQITGSDNPLLNKDVPEPKIPAAPEATIPPPSVPDVPAAPKPPTDSELPAGMSSDANAHTDKPSNTSSNGELDDVKKDALKKLQPLIEKLDLEPADKFDKYLMMLRASDDPALIKPAYNAAIAIKGEKEKAQALLDVINEINYITANK